MTKSALDKTCEKYGCAKVWLDPKLHAFDDCFGGDECKIRMGDIDAAVERHGHILWMEWKRGAVLESFETDFQAQFRQAREFTLNSRRQTFVFVLGCPVEMRVDAFRVLHDGKWLRDWEATGTEGFRDFLRRWFAYADRQRAAA